MNIFKRLFSRQEKASKVSGIVVNGGSGAIWPPRNYETFANESYLKNVIAFRCIDLISKSVSSVDWKLYSLVNDDIVEIIDDPLTKIVTRANPQESFSFLMLKWSAYMAMCGNAFIEKVSPMTGDNAGIPKELYVHRPDFMKILQDSKGQLAGYEYSNMYQTVRWDVDSLTGKSDILHLKTFHPTDDWWGAAPTESAAREIDSSNEATEWNKSLLQNQGRPGMLFKFKGNLTDQQFERLEKRLKEKFSGPTQVGTNMILEADGDAEPFGWSPQELDFLEGGREQARRICLGYGVPPMLLGIPGDNTYSNLAEARRAFWEETVIFYLNYFKNEFNNWLFETGDIYFDYCLDNVPALETKRSELWERAEKSTFLTINEKRAMVGLPAVDDGDVVYVNASMIPIGEEPDMSEEIPAGMMDDEDDDSTENVN